MSLLRSVMFMALFLSTLSLRRATWHLCFCIPCQCNFYPRSPCGERRAIPCYRHDVQNISIHALLAESDPLLFRATSRQTHFYPRSPCGERPKSANTLPAVTLFLSTLSLRRATYTAICLAPPILFLSTLSLRRATGRGPHSPLVWQISIHALLAESDL